MNLREILILSKRFRLFRQARNPGIKGAWPSNRWQQTTNLTVFFTSFWECYVERRESLLRSDLLVETLTNHILLLSIFSFGFIRFETCSVFRTFAFASCHGSKSTNLHFGPRDGKSDVKRTLFDRKCSWQKALKLSTTYCVWVCCLCARENQPLQ